jgi:hypothetical protein
MRRGKMGRGGGVRGNGRSSVSGVLDTVRSVGSIVKARMEAE